MKDYLEYINSYDYYKALADNKSTKKDSFVELFFYKLYEMIFLMTLFFKKQIPKVFGFRTNEGHSCIPEEYKENRKIDLIKYEFNSKHLIFYQSNNYLEPLFKQISLIREYSSFWSERFTNIMEALFYSYVNVSFKTSFNFIKLVVIGKLGEENLYINNFINNEKKKFVYKFNNIVFLLSFDYYYYKKNDGKRLVKIKLKIYFPEIYRYSSYFNLFVEKHINRYLIKKYDCNRIFMDILSKRRKLIFAFESKKKYNLNIILTIIHDYFRSNIDAENEEDFKNKYELALKNGLFDDLEKNKELNDIKIIRNYYSENPIFEEIEIKEIEEAQSRSLFYDIWNV